MRTTRIVLIFAFGVIAAMLGVWAGDRNPATESLLAEARPPDVLPGGQLHIAYEFRRYRLCPRETQRTIFDGQNIRFDLGTQMRALSGPVGADSYVQPITVPPAAAPGPARYRVMIYDYCNPLHRLWPLSKVIEIPFTILPETPLPSNRN
ncbi:hypothetical protein SAMN02745157_1484 [Kaistia soli DSM 19436]|uniref:Uncharacterized protein n=1 Tax=Kaistia soli DSM 19436 TaxID=1122133 RepID=A0A1M4YCN3_9HYPH|nr:hypothetical protein [Kaistia soli]SHF03487.1 hypothetical protein SAMN02745157_1484 [Kaistia soli DSM 19436]